jgi:hypothetical protein
MGLYASTNQEQDGENEEESLLEGTNYVYGRKQEVTFGANQAHQGPSMYDSAKKTAVQLNAGDRAFFNSPMKGVPTYDPTQVQPASALPKSILKDSGRGFFNSPMKGVATLPQPDSSRTAFDVDREGVSDGLFEESIETKPVEEKKKRNTKENKNINLKRKTPELKESTVTNSPAKNSPAGKKRKLTKTGFLSEAKQIEIKIDEDTYYVDPFAASAKDLGWMQSGTHLTQVGDRQLNVKWELTMTIEEEI